MIWLILGISLEIHSTGWQAPEPARVTVKENVQSPQQVALNLEQTTWGQEELQSEDIQYRCGHCGEVCCEENGIRECYEGVCQDNGQYLPDWRCVCNDRNCGHLGQPCCSPPNDACVGNLVCVNDTCRQSNIPSSCGSLYKDINGGVEGGKLYIVNQLDTLNPRLKSLPVVFLIHGMGGKCYAWNDYINWFKNRGYRIGNVSLYPQEWPHRWDCSSSYTPFCPNGKMLKTLADTFHNYLVQNYSSGEGWNNSIVAVAHSRGGLDIENAVAFQNLQNISGIISLATPWWGSTLANLCLNPAPISSLLCFHVCAWNPACMAACVLATSVFGSRICTSMNPDARIVNTHIMPHYRQVFSLPDIPYFGGIGYDDDRLCRNFTENYDIGCFLIRYFTGNYINDGAVNGSSVYAMQWNYGNRFNIFSKYSSSGNPYTGWRFPDPQEWRVDHSRVIHSYDIFRQVEYITRTYFTSSGSTNFSPGVDSQAIARIADRARTVESKGYIQFLLPGDTIRVLIGQSGISGMAIISTARLQSNAPREDFSETCDTCLIRSRIQVHSTSPQTIWVTSSDSGLVLFGFQEDTSIHFRLMRDRLIYLEGQTANLVLNLPSSVQEFEAYYSDNNIGGSNNAKSLKFRRVKPGVYAASISNLRSGYYSVLVQVNGRTYKRTLMMNFMVIDENDPLYELVSTTNIPYGGRSKFDGKRKKESSEKTIIIHGGELHVSQLELPAKKDETRYYIYNLSGKLIRAGVLSGKSINLKELNPGVYILKVSGRNYKILIK